MKIRQLLSAITVLPLLLSVNAARAEVSFTHDIAPIILKRCTGCHGDKINLGGYRAHTFQFLMKPAGSGSMPVVPGKPEQSTLYRLVATKLATVRMPKSDDPLSPEQIALIRNWILEGGKFDGPDPSAPLRSSLGPRVHPSAPAVYRAAVPVMAIALAPGGETLAAGGYNEITLWSKAGKLLRRINHMPQRIQSLAYSADGSHLLVAGGTPGEYGEASVLDLSSGTKPLILGTYSDIALTAVYERSGKRIAVGGADGSVSLYDAATAKREWTSSLHSDWVTSVSFSSDGKFIASAGKDMTVKLHNIEDGTLYTTYAGHNRQIGRYRGHDPVYSVHFEAGSSIAASAGGGKWIQLWDPVKTKEEAGSAADMEERFAKQGHTKYIPHGFTRPVLATVLSGSKLFAASADGSVKEFDIDSLTEVRTFNGHADWVCSIDYDEISHTLVSGAFNGEIRVWNSQTGDCTKSFMAKP